MSAALERLLGLVCRELEADDARIELGGRGPREPGAVVHETPSGWRVVALYDEPPADRAPLEAKLGALVESFGGSLAEVIDDRPPLPGGAQLELDTLLAELADRTDALRVVVIDDASPVLWGSSETPRLDRSVHDLMAVAALARDLATLGVDAVEELSRATVEAAALRARLTEAGAEEQAARVLARRVMGLLDAAIERDYEHWRRTVLTARALARVRAEERDHQHDREHEVVREAGFGYVAQGFASIYVLLLVFGDDMNPLKAEGHAVKVLPTIEKLVLALPPRNPDPAGGEVLRLRRRR